MKTPSIEFEIQNFKSYFGDPCKVEIEKPITLIVGPNGEGKTNLLQAMLLVLDEFTERYPKIRDRSLFTQEVELSGKPRSTTSLRSSVIYEVRSTEEKTWDPRCSEVFSPESVVSHRRRRCSLSLSAHRPRADSKGRVIIAECVVSYSGSPRRKRVDKAKRKISHIDLIYLSPEAASLDVFVKLIGQEFSRLISAKTGQETRFRFFRDIIGTFPSEEKRLIRDVERGKFREAYSDEGFFLTSGLAGGAKKELILYSIGLMMERNNEIDDWLAVLLVDELGQGLHLSRQTELANALVTFLGKDRVKGHIRLIATTHSPLIYSEIAKQKDVADIYFALREKGGPSKVAKWGEGDDQMIEKMLTTKLWLNIFTLPEKLVFVEGPTDKLFFDRVLSQIPDMETFELQGASVPNVLLDLLKRFPLARLREYFAVGDESAVQTLSKAAEKLKKEGVHLEVISTGSNSLEEFILGISKDTQGTELWNRLENEFAGLEKKVDDMDLTIPHIDVAEARARIDSIEREGVNSFLKSVKKNTQIYEIVGEHWATLLPETSRSQIQNITERIERARSQM